VLGVEFSSEDLRAGKAVHVPSDGKSEEIEQSWRDIDERTTWLASGRDRCAVREQESVGASLMCAAESRIAEEALEQPLSRRLRLHPEAGDDNQEIIRTELRQRVADEVVDVVVILLEHAAEPPAFVLRHVAELLRLSEAQVVVTDGIETGVAHGEQPHVFRRIELSSTTRSTVLITGDTSCAMRDFLLDDRVWLITKPINANDFLALLSELVAETGQSPR